jgi:hypothetical protein
MKPAKPTMGYAPAAIISITLMYIHLFLFGRFRTGRQDE